VTNSALLGRSQGLQLTTGPSLLNLRFESNVPFFYIMLALCVAMVAGSLMLERSKLGFDMIALREQHQAAEALGVATDRVKQIAFVVSAMLTAVGGFVFDALIRFVESGYDLSLAITLIMVMGRVLGGRGMALGPFVGGLIVMVVQEGPSPWTGPAVDAPGRRQADGRSARRPLAPRSAGHVLYCVMLIASDIDVRFGGLTAVGDVSLAAPRDKILAIIGPNGAGKTTLFAVLSGFLAPTRGSVTLDGMRLDGMPPHAIARTFQIVRPFLDMSVLENVIVGVFARTTSYHDAAAASARVLEQVGLYPKRSFLPVYLTLPDLKRLEVARGPGDAAQVPAAGRGDGRAQSQGAARRGDHARGGPRLRHRLRTVLKTADRAYVIENGRVELEGTAQALASDPRVIAAYFGAGSKEHI